MAANQYNDYLNKGISINELFLVSTNGIDTNSDGKLVNFEKFENTNQLYNYRPFDLRNIEYDLKNVHRHNNSVMQHMQKDNLAIMTCQQLSTSDFKHIFVSKYLVDICSISLQKKETTFAFPLYLYPENNFQQTIGQTTVRTPNLNTEIVQQIADKLGLTFTNEKETTKNTFAPIDILDYIYAVLHSPTYRKKYKEFLKIDFPRVPYPKNKDIFWQLVKLGGKICQLHLLESPTVENLITQYPIDGDNMVRKIRFEENYEIIDGDNILLINPMYPMGRVYINDTQYFQRVPTKVWNFFIGGYQPAQKWLKDRKDRKLDFDDILHYQKMIVALMETDRLMKEIDEIGIE